MSQIQKPTGGSMPVAFASRNALVYQFSTGKHCCLQCSSALFSGRVVDTIMLHGKTLGMGEDGWLARMLVKESDTQRCDICGRQVR